MAFGSVWAWPIPEARSAASIPPRSTTLQLNSISAEDGRWANGYGALRRHDVPSGNVIRFHPADGRLAGAIRVTAAPPDRSSRGVRPTAIGAGAAIWVTVSD